MKDDPVIVKTAELIKENCSEIVKIYLISYKVDNGRRGYQLQACAYTEG